MTDGITEDCNDVSTYWTASHLYYSPITNRITKSLRARREDL